MDCADDNERDEVQRVMNELSQLRLVRGQAVVNAWPYFQRHRGELAKLFDMVAKGGPKSLMSATGLSLMTQLTRK